MRRDKAPSSTEEAELTCRLEVEIPHHRPDNQSHRSRRSWSWEKCQGARQSKMPWTPHGICAIQDMSSWWALMYSRPIVGDQSCQSAARLGGRGQGCLSNSADSEQGHSVQERGRHIVTGMQKSRASLAEESS